MPTWWAIAAVAISATLTAGCSSDRTATAPAPGAAAGKTSAAASGGIGAGETAPVAPLDSSQCADVTGANVDLLAASDKDGARKAADTLEHYNPPASVKTSIEHFVTTGGAHFDDPDYTKSHKTLDEWVNKVCPA
jgi:hypothetical protein